MFKFSRINLTLLAHKDEVKMANEENGTKL